MVKVKRKIIVWWRSLNKLMKKLSLFLVDWIIFFKEIKEKFCYFVFFIFLLINFKKLIFKMLNCLIFLIYWIIYSVVCMVYFLFKRSWINNWVVIIVCLLKMNIYFIYRYWLLYFKKIIIYLLYKYFFKVWYCLVCNINLKLKLYVILWELFVNVVFVNF